MYGKVFESIYDGSLYGEWEAIVVFKALIVLADERGVIDMSPAALAGRTSYPVEIVNKGLEVLQRPDPDSRSDTSDGRRIEPLDQRTFGWRIVNYMHYRNLASRDGKRMADRARRAEIRNKNKEVADGREESQIVADGRECAQEVADGREGSPQVAKVAYTDTYTYTGKNPPPPSGAPPPGEELASDENVLVSNHSPPVNKPPAKTTTPAKRKTRIPTGFELTDRMRDNAINYWVQRERWDLDPDEQFDEFVTHYTSNGETRADWQATWKTWYVKSIKFNRRPDNGQHNRPDKPRSNVERLIAEREERERRERGNVYEHDTDPPPH